MNADLKWLAENERYWADDSAGVVQISGGQAEYLNGVASQYHGVGRVCFTRPQWQAARDELEEKKEKPTMHADLIWLVENVTEWHEDLDRVARHSGGIEWFSHSRFPYWKGFTRAEWQAARDELAKKGDPKTYAQFLAEKLSFWRCDYTHCFWIFDGREGDCDEWPRFNYGQGCSKEDWQAARDELENPFMPAHDNTLDSLREGKIKTFTDPSGNRWRLGDDGMVYGMCAPVQDPFSSPEEEEAWAEAEHRMDAIGQNGPTGEHYEAELDKQARYQDAAGQDWIDEAARTFTPEEFRGAMKFTIGKYVRRMGKKDSLPHEIEKIRDYTARWLKVEQGR